MGTAHLELEGWPSSYGQLVFLPWILVQFLFPTTDFIHILPVECKSCPNWKLQRLNSFLWRDEPWLCQGFPVCFQNSGYFIIREPLWAPALMWWFGSQRSFWVVWIGTSLAALLCTQLDTRSKGKTHKCRGALLSQAEKSAVFSWTLTFLLVITGVCVQAWLGLDVPR